MNRADSFIYRGGKTYKMSFYLCYRDFGEGSTYQAIKIYSRESYFIEALFSFQIFWLSAFQGKQQQICTVKWDFNCIQCLNCCTRPESRLRVSLTVIALALQTEL
uniref:Uncharacterized protein n=1 Tax=Micrurus surinamensis TaxID=129470 RepID=A0A2D4PAS5_MICSU